MLIIKTQNPEIINIAPQEEILIVKKENNNIPNKFVTDEINANWPK